MIHYDSKWIYISIINPFKELWKIGKVFKFPKIKFHYGLTWSPILWCSKPAPIHIRINNILWKDKFNTPRFEDPPHIWIHLFGFNLIWYLEAKDQYWEQALYYLYYCNEDIVKTKIYWPWEEIDKETHQSKGSSWNDNYLK